MYAEVRYPGGDTDDSVTEHNISIWKFYTIGSYTSIDKCVFLSNVSYSCMHVCCMYVCMYGHHVPQYVISSEFPPRGDVYFLRKTITPG